MLIGEEKIEMKDSAVQNHSACVTNSHPSECSYRVALVGRHGERAPRQREQAEQWYIDDRPGLDVGLKGECYQNAVILSGG